MENNINLNLLNILILLKKHRSMRAVAKVIGKSESAISKDFSKLRAEFNDELFVKTQSGFEPTHYLAQLYPQLESAYLQLVTVVNKPIEFKPEQYHELITIAVADAEYDYIVTQLYPQLSQLFPLAKFKFVTWDKDTVEQLLQGKISCGINLQNDHISKDIYQKTLYTDQIVIATHKQLNISTWQQIQQTPFVFIDVQGWNELNYRFKDILPKEHLQDIYYSIRVDKMQSALNIAAKSKLAIQTTLRYLNDDFVTIPYPKGIRFDIAYSFYCLQTNRHSPLIKILSKLIQQCYTGDE